MANENTRVNTSTEQTQLPEEWQERARKAARQFKLPVPSNEEIGSPEQVEERLRQAEQEGGE